MRERLRRLRGLIVCVVGVFQGTALADDAPQFRVEVHADDHERRGTPIRVALPSELETAAQLILVSRDRSESHPIQRRAGEEHTATFILPDAIPAGGSAVYLLSEADPADAAEHAVRCLRDEASLRVEVRGELVLQYNIDVVEPPEGIDPLYARSGHIHPVWTPNGAVVTDEFPVDHPHQHGIFHAWVNTTFEGRHVDFWNQRDRSGHVEHVGSANSSGDVLEGDVFIRFSMELRHSDLTAPGGPQPVLREVMTVTVYNVAEGRLFDVETRQTCVADAPLIINEYHYGGMAFRGSGEWLGQPEHEFLTSEGRTRKDGNHTRPVWTAAYGLVEGEPCSICVFGDPGNFRHPQPVRLHPSKPYFVYTPPALGRFTIDPGEEYTVRYRYLVHDGPADAEWYDRIWSDIAEPPTVRVTAAGL